MHKVKKKQKLKEKTLEKLNKKDLLQRSNFLNVPTLTVFGFAQFQISSLKICQKTLLKTLK